jgi:hypothetical protein
VDVCVWSIIGMIQKRKKNLPDTSLSFLILPPHIPLGMTWD